MARTTNKPTVPVDLVDVTPKAHENLSDLQDAATAQAEQVSRAMQVIGYDAPYDRTRLVQEARFYMAQSAGAMLEAGRRLMVLKENEPHGEFMEVIQNDLGLNPRTAQVMMQAAAKYLLNPALASNAQTFALLGKSKLFELMVEPDDDLAALAEGGTVAGKTLDEIDAMSVRELKTALRESKKEAEAKDKLREDMAQRLDKLKEKRWLIESSPDKVLVQLKAEATSLATETEGAIVGPLRHALIALVNHGDERGQQDVFMAGLLGQVQRQLNALREEFNLPDTAASGATPAWQQWADEQDKATAAEGAH